MSELGWSKCVVCNDEIGWPNGEDGAICYDCLATRLRALERENEELRVAVRWWADSYTEIPEPVRRWIEAYPIVRTVIEEAQDNNKGETK